MAKRRTIETDIFGIEVKPTSRIDSRAKGVRNENRAAKVLEQWTGVPFTRVPRSGGLRWRDTANVCGDLVCEVQDFDFPFSIETKHLKKVTFIENRPLRSNSLFFTIWEQATEGAERAGKTPLAMIRENGMPKDTYYIVTSFEVNLKPLATGISKQGIEIYIYDSRQFFKLDFDRIKTTVQ